MLLRESEPDPVQAQRLTVRLLEAHPVKRLPLLCMCLAFVSASHLYSILDYYVIKRTRDPPSVSHAKSSTPRSPAGSSIPSGSCFSGELALKTNLLSGNFREYPDHKQWTKALIPLAW